MRMWLAVSIVVVYAALIGIGVAFIRMDFFCKALHRGPAHDARAALTFDDGPDGAVTPRILDVLKSHNVRATFFCIGQRAIENPDVAKRIVSEGHEIGNHTFSHGWWSNLLLARALAMEMSHAQEAIASTTGIAPRYFRPPMGLTNPHTRRALGEVGLGLVGWDVRSFDRGAEPDAVIDRVVDRVRPGSIVLLHDGGVDADSAVEVVSGIISRLKAKGFTFCTVSELAGAPDGPEEAS